MMHDDDDDDLIQILLESPTRRILSDNQFISDTFFQGTEFASLHGINEPNRKEPSSQVQNIEEQKPPEQIMPITIAKDVTAENDNQQSLPQQNLPESIYDHKNQLFLQPMPSETIIKYPYQGQTMEEQNPTEQIMPITNVTTKNYNQQYNECTLNFPAYRSENPVVLPPLPQHNFIQPIYNRKEQFVRPILPPETIIKYPNVDANIGGLYNGGIDFSTYNGGQGYGFLPGGYLSMLMSNQTPMSIPLLTMDYQNKTMMLSNQRSFQQYGHGSTTVQELGNKHHQQQQQPNNSLTVGCDNTTSSKSDISILNKPEFKVRCISPEEKCEKINRFRKKRLLRNFDKKIKYECRKTLADSRPRVRGRFAKNKNQGNATITITDNHAHDDKAEAQTE